MRPVTSRLIISLLSPPFALAVKDSRVRCPLCVHTRSMQLCVCAFNLAHLNNSTRSGSSRRDPLAWRPYASSASGSGPLLSMPVDGAMHRCLQSCSSEPTRTRCCVVTVKFELALGWGERHAAMISFSLELET